MKRLYTYDVETYSNYFLIKFQNIKTNQIRFLEVFNGTQKTNLPTSLIKFLQNKSNTFISFNGINFDALMIDAYIAGLSTKSIKTICDYIIKNGSPHWITRRKFNLREIEFDHIDIKECAPGVMISLKMYGARMGMPKLQDLPIEPDEVLTRQQADDISTYCDNDLETTSELYRRIEKEIKLREDLSKKYGVDMRSKSDAQMAESIFKVYLEKESVKVAKRKTQVKPFKYRVPDWVHFESDVFNEMLETIKNTMFSVNDKNVLTLPKALNKVIEFNGAKYKFGIGGLHSQEKAQIVIPSPDEEFMELDVSGFYPAIIIEQGLYPEHIGPKFLEVYSRNTEQRYILKDLAGKLYKRIKNEPDNKKLTDELDGMMKEIACVKIQNNGSYGKFGSYYSFLFSPELLLQTTITGQLSLLMLIEAVTKIGAKVYSANTDGINVLINKRDSNALKDVHFDWELTTGYTLETTPYLATYSRDVNSYIAIKDDGIKSKGAFAIGGLMKNPTNNICIEAVLNYLSKGESLESTIKNCSDITKFLTVRKVTGGAIYDNEQIGSAIRFYHSLNGKGISYSKNGNKVPKSDGCKPLMTLTGEFPDDVDFNWYIDEAKKQLLTTGYNGV